MVIIPVVDRSTIPLVAAQLTCQSQIKCSRLSGSQYSYGLKTDLEFLTSFHFTFDLIMT